MAAGAALGQILGLALRRASALRPLPVGPALASVLFGLSRASKESLDLVKVYGGYSPTERLNQHLIELM